MNKKMQQHKENKAVPPMVKHPAYKMAQSLLVWIKQDVMPMSAVLLQGFYLAEQKEIDGPTINSDRRIPSNPVHIKAVAQLMDAINRPEVDKEKIVGDVLKSIWVKKMAIKKPEEKKDTKKPKPSVSKNPRVVKVSAAKPAPSVTVKKRRVVAGS